MTIKRGPWYSNFRRLRLDQCGVGTVVLTLRSRLIDISMFLIAILFIFTLHNVLNISSYKCVARPVGLGIVEKATNLEEATNSSHVDSDPDYLDQDPNSVSSEIWIQNKTGIASDSLSPDDLDEDDGAHNGSNTSNLKENPSESPVGKLAREGHTGWAQFPYSSEGDETEQLMLPIRQNGKLPCHNVRTKTANLTSFPPHPSLESVNGTIHRLLAGPVHELVIISIGDDYQRRCAGGDYYETDLSGPRWRSRPPVFDLNDGTYSIQLQVHPNFAGVYTFKVVLLFSNFHALSFRPEKYARQQDIATFEIEFFAERSPQSVLSSLAGSFRPEHGSITAAPTGGSNSLSSITEVGAPDLELPICRRKDFETGFEKKYWTGRWTRERVNKDCDYDKDGLWRCVDLKLQCQKPWCEGPVGSLDSNGWVYSAHCAFKIFQQEEAWKCLDGKWLFFWGDSNHGDTIRNLLNFVLGFKHQIEEVARTFDTTYYSPKDKRYSVRITSMFNGHADVQRNWEGLSSLHNLSYADQLRSYFTGDTAPDFLIMNSGLHDARHWKDTDGYLLDGVDFAADFWNGVWNGMRARRPDILYRTTVAAAGKHRIGPMNPHKMELFNHLMVDRFLKLELERFQIIDGFDLTFPWHWDYMTSDGVHYGRHSADKKKGHRYFVDLMLIHMLLNAICLPKA